MQMTADQFKTAFPGREPSITQALYLHLVEGMSVTEAARLSNVSRSGVYKALRTPARRARATVETWQVACPIKYAPILRERIERQLAIWAAQDQAEQAAKQAVAGVMDRVVQQPQVAQQPQATQVAQQAPMVVPLKNFGPYPISTVAPVPLNQAPDYYGNDGHVRHG